MCKAEAKRRSKVGVAWRYAAGMLQWGAWKANAVCFDESDLSSQTHAVSVVPTSSVTLRKARMLCMKRWAHRVLNIRSADVVHLT